jgi:hypothetical protein
MTSSRTTTSIYIAARIRVNCSFKVLMPPSLTPTNSHFLLLAANVDIIRLIQ